MTVKELIEILNNFDGDKEVEMAAWDGEYGEYYFREIDFAVVENNVLVLYP